MTKGSEDHDRHDVPQSEDSSPEHRRMEHGRERPGWPRAEYFWAYAWVAHTLLARGETNPWATGFPH